MMMPTLQEEHTQAFLRRDQINNRLADNEREMEALKAERQTLRAEREQLSRRLEQIGIAQTVQTHEQATAVARQQAEAIQAEADKLKADLAEKNSEADALLAKLREQFAAGAAKE